MFIKNCKKYGQKQQPLAKLLQLAKLLFGTNTHYMGVIFLIFRDKFNIIIILATCLLIYSTSSCDRHGHAGEKNLENIKVEVNINRIENQIKNIKQKEDVAKFLDKNETFARIFLQKGVIPDSVVENSIWKISQSTYIDTLTRQTNHYFGDMADLKAQFEKAFKIIKLNYPEFTPPPIYTVVTGFENDVYVSDSLIVIGLDCFLGDKAHYRMRDVPNYIYRRYRKEYVVPSVMMFLSNKYNEVETDFRKKTLLNEMIYHGKTYYFMERVIPNVPDSLVIGYTGREVENCRFNQDIIWGHFVENNLFFDASLDKINRYIGERPFVGEIGDECPGRIGRWLGWQIVRKYMESNPTVTLPNLMKDMNAKVIFEKSNYKPLQQ